MKNYICGLKVQAENPDDAIIESMFPVEEILIQDTISCIESPGVGIDFLGWFLPLTFIGFLLLGFVLGCKYKNDKRPVYLCDNPDH